MSSDQLLEKLRILSDDIYLYVKEMETEKQRLKKEVLSLKQEIHQLRSDLFPSTNPHTSKVDRSLEYPDASRGNCNLEEDELPDCVISLKQKISINRPEMLNKEKFSYPTCSTPPGFWTVGLSSQEFKL